MRKKFEKINFALSAHRKGGPLFFWKSNEGLQLVEDACLLLSGNQLRYLTGKQFILDFLWHHKCKSGLACFGGLNWNLVGWIHLLDRFFKNWVQLSHDLMMFFFPSKNLKKIKWKDFAYLWTNLLGNDLSDLWFGCHFFSWAKLLLRLFGPARLLGSLGVCIWTLIYCRHILMSLNFISLEHFVVGRVCLNCHCQNIIRHYFELFTL